MKITDDLRDIPNLIKILKANPQNPKTPLTLINSLMGKKDFTMELWLFTLGYLVQHIGTGLLLWKVYKQKSVYGISIDT